MPVARVVSLGPLEAVVQVEALDAWRPLLTCRGPDAEARAHDLRRLLEAGALVVAGDAPREVLADEHPSPWVRLCDAVAALGEPAADTLRRIERGELRHREDDDGIFVAAEDLAAIGRSRELEADARRTS